MAILSQYALPDTNTQKYPALQADDYQPKGLKSQINICLAEESVNLLSPEAIQLLDFDVKPATFGDDEITLFVPKSDVRYVILGMPRLFLYNKETKRHERLESGTKLAGSKKVTAAKLFVCLVVGDNLLLNNDNKPQVFTLNLRSSKTAILKARSPQPGDGTIYSLNTGLNKHYNIKGWLAHLASVKINAVPEKFTSSVSGDTSYGIKFVLESGALELSDANQKLMFELSQDPDLQSDMKDPYRLNGSTEATTPDSAPSNEMLLPSDDYLF